MPKDARFGLAAGIGLLIVILVVFCRKPVAPINKIGENRQNVAATTNTDGKETKPRTK